MWWGPLFVLSGPLMLADFNEAVCKELQKYVLSRLGWGGLLLYVSFQIRFAA